jgi:hypothetical protein
MSARGGDGTAGVGKAKFSRIQEKTVNVRNLTTYLRYNAYL